MTRFRPCIDLHAGQVKQIVGGTLDAHQPAALQTNFVAALPPSHYAGLYRDHGLTGAHVIMLGGGAAQEAAAHEALAAWPGGLQLGGGITPANAAAWIAAGADRVIVTSYLFSAEDDSTETAPTAPIAKTTTPVVYRFRQDRLDAVLAALGGDRQRLVIDLSCRRVETAGHHHPIDTADNRIPATAEEPDTLPQWIVAINKWQTLTDMHLSADVLARLAPFCSEFLIHAADVEGLQGGIDADLVRCLGQWSHQIWPDGHGQHPHHFLPFTFAGGARCLDDLDRVGLLSRGRVDLTIGSALDCFGGAGVRLDDCIAWNAREAKTKNDD